MNLTLSLTPAEEAALLASAHESGITPEQMVRRAIQPIVSPDGQHVASANVQKPSLLGIWEQFGPGPSEQEIDQNRLEMFSTFVRDDIA